MPGPTALAPLVLMALTAGPAFAQAESATTTTVPPMLAPPKQTTTVQGTLPDLTGRWLALARLDIPAGRVKTVAAFWDIRGRSGQPEMDVQFVALPHLQQAALDRANQADQPWQPSPADLAAVAANWVALPAQYAKVAEVETTFVGRDAFDASIKGEPKVRDSLWVVKQTHTFEASAAPTVRQYYVYGALEARDGGYTGVYATTVLAAAPFPIPITFQGTLELYRLDGAGGGLLGRLAALFSGCGRGR